ncbi:MAG: malyl-CoA thiolesterase [Thalassobius sp.]|nr:malyl-CoA thiolesterase [Thalassovita sp.]
MSIPSRMLEAYGLGATLYMPIIHPRVPAILSGREACPARSIVLCLEDALAENDVDRGISVLRSVLGNVAHRSDLRVFVRPRSLEMAHRLSGFRDIGRIEGFVAPKVRPETAGDWMDLVATRGLKIMPTLETADFFDPGRIAAVRDVFNMFDPDRISAIRLGGNDFLGALGLRRTRGVTSWEGPLGWVLSMCSAMFVSAGYPVAAPVYDVIDDLDTLRRETERDVAAGFIGKTAIHPAQIPVITEAFRVGSDDLAQARAILDESAGAVFQIGGVMCEPSTHHNWACRVTARNGIFGCRGVPEVSAMEA